MNAKWESFWEGQTQPLWAEETETHYRSYAAELSLLFGDCPTDRVLEIGCGNGALYRHLGFDRAFRYLGIDISESMLKTFQNQYPNVDLLKADGADFRSDEKFDLIFSSGVAQCWDRDDLARHLDNANAMLSDEGLLVVSGIPWSRMRLAYARGDLTGGRVRRSAAQTFLAYLRELVHRRLGTWYDFPAFESLATARGFHLKFFGSLHYPYRFHVVMRRGEPTEVR
jgi:cyclopropane fatty-acyl-phospholipid synthase-like methyltransferase